MRIELTKLYTDVKNCKTEDFEFLKNKAIQILKVLERYGGDSKNMDNYNVYEYFEGEEDFVIRDKTKEFCLGWIEAQNSGRQVITVGSIIIWPEDEFGNSVAKEP